MTVFSAYLVTVFSAYLVTAFSAYLVTVLALTLLDAASNWLAKGLLYNDLIWASKAAWAACSRKKLVVNYYRFPTFSFYIKKCYKRMNINVHIS